jgi:hypothetical protein
LHPSAVPLQGEQTKNSIDLPKPIEVTSVLGGLHVDYRKAA